jgi:hypothetical protein
VVLAARCRRLYSNAHTYHINSVSVSSDQETFISADDLRVNLWHLDVTDQCFTIVDIKPPNMEDLTEARSHPPPTSPCRHAIAKSAAWPACAPRAFQIGRR